MDRYIKGKPLVVKRSDRVEDLEGSHLLFVGALEENSVPELLNGLRGHHVLTVGEVEDFTRHGGVIRFYVEQNSIRFEINLSAADRNRLRMAPQLLRLATIYQSGSR